MQPVTPPRSRGRRSSDDKATQLARGLYTPKTPFGRRLDHKKELLSPPVIAKPIHITPGPTPRHSTRKKREIGDAVTLFPTPQTSGRALFPPTPSTIGSGRNKNISSLSLQAPSINLIESSPIRHQIDVLEDSPLQAPTKRKLVFEETSEEENEKLEQSQAPGTPKGRLITDDVISYWNKDDFDDDNADEFIITKAPLHNPFITSGPPRPLMHRNKTPETELTLINKKGEKITRTLTLQEQSYKPKNLFNDLQKSASKVKNFHVFNDNE